MGPNLFILILLNDPENPDECYSNEKSRPYLGTLSHTKDGLKCQRWDILNSDYEDNFNFQHNYCRNQDGDIAPWCWTNYWEEEWGYCDVPECSGRLHIISSSTFKKHLCDQILESCFFFFCTKRLQMYMRIWY